MEEFHGKQLQNFNNILEHKAKLFNNGEQAKNHLVRKWQLCIITNRNQEFLLIPWKIVDNRVIIDGEF